MVTPVIGGLVARCIAKGLSSLDAALPTGCQLRSLMSGKAIVQGFRVVYVHCYASVNRPRLSKHGVCHISTDAV